jgi:hypothetical protein
VSVRYCSLVWSKLLISRSGIRGEEPHMCARGRPRKCRDLLSCSNRKPFILPVCDHHQYLGTGIIRGDFLDKHHPTVSVIQTRIDLSMLEGVERQLHEEQKNPSGEGSYCRIKLLKKKFQRNLETPAHSPAPRRTYCRTPFSTALLNWSSACRARIRIPTVVGLL